MTPIQPTCTTCGKPAERRLTAGGRVANYCIQHFSPGVSKAIKKHGHARFETIPVEKPVVPRVRREGV
jgi:hypothetical protein